MLAKQDNLNKKKSFSKTVGAANIINKVNEEVEKEQKANNNASSNTNKNESLKRLLDTISKQQKRIQESQNKKSGFDTWLDSLGTDYEQDFTPALSVNKIEENQKKLENLSKEQQAKVKLDAYNKAREEIIDNTVDTAIGFQKATEKVLTDFGTTFTGAYDNAKEFFDEYSRQLAINNAQNYEQDYGYLNSYGFDENGNYGLLSNEQKDKRTENLIDELEKRDNFDLNDENNLTKKLQEHSAKLQQEIYENATDAQKLFYQTYESTLNFGLHFMLGLVTGGGNALTLTTMGMQSGVNKTYENLEKGYNYNTALGNGILTGIASAFVEKLGLDNFTNIIANKSGQMALAAITSQAMSEGLEEGIEYNVDALIDGITTGNWEYNPGDLFASVAMGAISGGVLGGLGNVVPALRNRKAVNQAKAEIQTLEQFKRDNTLTEADINAIDSAINMANVAISNYYQKSTVGDAVQFKQDEVKPLDAQTIQENFYRFLQPQVDAETKTNIEVRQSVERLKAQSQELLSRKGINMDALQYSTLSPEVKGQVDSVQDHANKLGVNLAFDTDLETDGMYMPETKRLYINPNSNLGPLTVFTHELTHNVENAKTYKNIQDLVTEDYDKKELNRRVENIKRQYTSKGIKLSDEEALKEFVAIEMQNKLGDDKFINRLINYNESLAYRMYENIKNVINTNELLGNNDALKNIEYNFLKAFRDRNVNTSNIGVSGDLVYSLNTSFDQEVEAISNGTFKSTMNAVEVRDDSPQWMTSLGYNNYPMLMTEVHIKNGLGIGTGKHQHNISKETLKKLPELLEDPIAVFKYQGDSIVALLKATDNSNRVLLAAIKPDGRGKYNNVDIDSNFVLSAYGRNSIITYYNKKLDGNLIYPVGKTKKDIITEALGLQSPKKQHLYLDNNISNSQSNVNNNGHSIGLDSTRVKDLLAIHNTSADKLRKSLDLGGLAMPSIAVTRDDINHEGFGDISLVFDSNTIDPESSARNKVYSGDAWTPIFPTVEYEVDYDEGSKLYSQIRELSKKYNMGKSVSFEPGNIEDSLNNGRIDNLIDNELLKLAYLEENGMGIGELPRKEIDTSDNALSKILSKEEIETLADGYYESSNEAIDIAKRVSQEYVKEYQKRYDELPENAPQRRRNILKRNIEEYSNPSDSTLMRIMHNANDLRNTYRINENGGVIDEEAFREKVDSLIDEDYYIWAENKINSLINDKGIVNGTEPYTKSGNRRAFNKTHDPYTLESVVDNMMSQSQTAKGGFGSGLTNLLAANSKEFNSIDDIIEAENYLANEEPGYEELNNRYSSLRESIVSRWKYKDADTWTAFEDFSEVSSNIAKMNNLTPTKVKREFTKNDYQITDDQAKEFLDILNEGSKLTKTYFEAKPQRAIRFDEVRQAYYPKGTNQDLVNRLNEYGIETIEYDPETESRRDKINERANDYKFSIGLSDTVDNSEIIDTNIGLKTTDDTVSNYDKIYDKYIKEYNINDTDKFKKLCNQALTELKEDGFVYTDTYDDIAEYIFNTSTVEVKDPFKEEAKEFFKGNTYFLDPKKARDVQTENAFVLNKQMPNGIRFTKRSVLKGRKTRDFDDAVEEFLTMNGKSDTAWGLNVGDMAKNLYDLLTKSDTRLAKTMHGEDWRQDIQIDVGEMVSEMKRQLDTDKYNEYLDEYGKIMQGEDPKNDFAAPKRTGENEKVSMVARTIGESGVLKSDAEDELKADIGAGIFSYKPTTNKELVDRANERLEDMTIDEAVTDFLSSKDSNSQVIAQGEVLLRKLGETGDSKNAIKVASELTKKVHEAASSLQAMRILKRLTPEGRLITTEQNIRRIQNTLDIARGKKAPKIQISDELKTKLLNAKTEEEITSVLNEISIDIGKQMPSTLMDKLNTWRFLSMLGNPKTHIRNITGNLVFKPVVDIKNYVGAAIESAAQKSGLIDERTKTVLNSKDKALIEFAKKDYDKISSNLMDKNGKYDLSELIQQNRDVYNNDKVIGRALNKLVKLNSALLEKEDLFFSKDRYAKSLAQFMKANGLTENDVNTELFEKGQDYAMKESLKATYRDNVQFLNVLNGFLNKHRVIKLFVDAVLPFKKTPINIVKRGVEYSPINLIYTLSKRTGDLKQGKISANEYIDSLAQGLTGTGIAALGMFLASNSILRIADDDKDRKQRYDQELGEQNYSIVFPWGSYTIDWASPTIMPLAIGAEVYRQLTSENDGNILDNALDILTSTAEPIFETSMLSGLMDTINTYSELSVEKAIDMVTSAASSYAMQYVPTMFGQIARVIDGTQRTTYPNTGPIDKTLKQFVNKIPILSKLGQASINSKGEEVQREDLGLGWVGRALLELSPGYYKSNESDDFSDEIISLYNATGEANVLPSSSTTSITYDGNTYKLLNDEFTNFQKGKNKLDDTYVREFVNSMAYDSLDDSQKADIISDIRDYSRDEQKSQYLNSKGIDYEDTSLNKANGALEAGVPLYEYFMSKEAYNGMSGEDKKQDYINYLNSSNLSSQAKNYLFDTQYDSDFSSSVNDFSKEYKLSYEQQFALKETSTIEGVKDSNGKTIANSKALQVRKQYEDMGQYNNLVDYLNNNDLEASDMNLTKTVANMSQSEFEQAYNEVFGGGSSYTDKPSSTSTSGTRKTKKQTRAILKNIADISSDTFKKIDDILERFVYDKDTVDSNKVKVEFQKEGLNDIIQKYLDENPYVDKSVFGL